MYLSAETMMSTPPPTSELQQPPPQALHYALANAQQVQIHQIGEDGQVQVVCTSLQSALVSGRGGEGEGHDQLFLQFWTPLTAWGKVPVTNQSRSSQGSPPTSHTYPPLMVPATLRFCQSSWGHHDVS